MLMSFTGLAQPASEQDQIIDSIQNVIKTASHDSIIIKNWKAWDDIIYASNPELDLTLNLKIDSLCELNLEKNLDQNEKSFFLTSKGSALNNLGLIYMDQGDHARAIQYYVKSLDIFKALKDQNGMARAYNNIGNIYNYQNNYEKAIEYYNQSLKLYKALEYIPGMAHIYNNLGGIFLNQKKYTEALDYQTRGLDIYMSINEKAGMADSYSNIGNIYYVQKDYASAIKYFENALNIIEGSDDKKRRARILNNIGIVYHDIGDYTKAKTYSQKSLGMAQDIESAFEIFGASNNLWKINKKLGLYKESLSMYELATTTRDTINSAENQMEVIRQEFKFNYEKKEAVANANYQAALEKQRLETQANQERQTIIIIAVSSILGLAALFLIFAFNRLRITKKQKSKIENQKHIIENTHTEITDSINYAKRLQDAILPSFNEVNQHLPRNFIFFKPKNVVSGDFYWFEHLNNVSYIAAADCTGHGVPGAMVSVVCSNALDRSVKEFGMKAPAQILDKTREIVIETFAKSGEAVKDGMDISLCAIDQNKVIYSGANNPLWIVRKTAELTAEQKLEKGTITINDTSLIELKADKQPIGLYTETRNFTQREIEVFPDDKLYLFTDGYADQFGGEKGKKFKYKSFKRFLIELSSKSMSDQAQLISHFFDEWKGDLEQVDDVCIIGIQPYN